MTRDYVLARLRDLLYGSNTPDGVHLYAAVEANLNGVLESATVADEVSQILTWKDVPLPELLTAEMIEERIAKIILAQPHNYINAIKEWRRLTGNGLADSKRAVAEIRTRHRLGATEPRDNPAPTDGICRHLDCTGELRVIPSARQDAPLGYQCIRCGQNYSYSGAALP